MNHISALLFWVVASAAAVVPGGPAGGGAGAFAAELVIVEEAGCPWCARWNEEIGVVYDKTDEGRRAPLRRVDIRALPDDLSFTTPPRYTPTFVVFEEGAEMGRIEGYPGEDFFWPLLQRILARLPEEGAATAPEDGS